MRFKFGCPEKTIPNMSNTSRSCQFAVGQTPTTLGTSSASAANTFSLSRSFFAKEYTLRTTSNRLSRFGQSTAVKSESMSNFSSSRRCSAISTNRARSTIRMACLRSSIASRSAAPNLARNRVTNSLSSGVCSTTGGLGGAGAAGFAGTAGALASAGLAEGAATGGAIGCGESLTVHKLQQGSSREFNRRVSNTRCKPSQSEQLANDIVGFEQRRRITAHAHSREPFLYSHQYPTSRIPRNAIIEIRANSPWCAATHPLYRIAQGMRNIVSTSKITNSMATIKNRTEYRPRASLSGGIPHS